MAVIASSLDSASVVFILACGIIGIGFAVALLLCVRAIKLEGDDGEDLSTSLLAKSGEGNELDEPNSDPRTVLRKMVEIYSIIQRGAKAFLWAEYKLCFIFIALFGIIVGVLVSHSGEVIDAANFIQDFNAGPTKDPYTMSSTWHGMAGGLTCASFVVGALTSILSGYIGMMVAVYSNARTTKQAMQDDDNKAWRDSFNAAFRAGGVMGYSLCGISLLMCYVLIRIYYFIYPIGDDFEFNQLGNPLSYSAQLFECLAGYGLGGSTIALFGRVGGGIYTKAADVGADLAGKVVENLPEDDPRNPAVIADNVGDNVGDVAGMGSDLFGSFGEATCAALVISSLSPEIVAMGLPSIIFPLYISAVGIPVCMLTSFVATNCWTVRGTRVRKVVQGKEIEADDSNVETVLKVQLLVATLLMTAVLYPVCHTFLPTEFSMDCQIVKALQNNFIPWFDDLLKNTSMLTGASSATPWVYTYNNGTDILTGTLTRPLCATHVTNGPLYAYVSIVSGLWAGCLIGFITEFYTSKSYRPTQELAASTKTGAATNIIYGLALGYQSVIIPIVLLAIIIYVSFYLLGMFGVSLAALGMLSILATCLAIDVYGPVCDNAGGIAEMAGCEDKVRQKTDALDAAGNTTAAIGKGFAIGSAALVSLALFGAFVTRAGLASQGINMLQPMTFAFLLLGCMLPYAFTAMTMKSVGQAAMKMVEEVGRQFRENPGIMTGETQPNYDLCIAISTDASLQQMIAPGLLVILTPILTGILFGIEAVCGLLAGALVSAVQMAISQSNSGGAWDNAKKYIEHEELFDDEGNVIGKGSDAHKAAVVGDTVGDPLKDTSGPALNIVMKLMAIISLVFANFFLSINNGSGAFGLPNAQLDSNPLAPIPTV